MTPAVFIGKCWKILLFWLISFYQNGILLCRWGSSELSEICCIVVICFLIRSVLGAVKAGLRAVWRRSCQLQLEHLFGWWKAEWPKKHLCRASTNMLFTLSTVPITPLHQISKVVAWWTSINSGWELRGWLKMKETVLERADRDCRHKKSEGKTKKAKAKVEVLRAFL